MNKQDLIESCNKVFQAAEELETQADDLYKQAKALRRLAEELPSDILDLDDKEDE